MGSREETFAFAGQNFPSERVANQFLPRLWATRRVGYLLEQTRLNGENRELVDEIVGLGTRFGIVTPYTSFLVTEDMKDLPGRPVPFPQTRMEPNRGNGVGMVLGGTREVDSEVRRSKAEKSMKQSDSAASPEQYMQNIRTVGSKTFTLKDGVWVDTEYKEGSKLPRVEVKFGTDEFFRLIADEPKLAEFFALGEKVIVVLGNRIYKVT
jgi:Ca-activated chloride channel family protein